MDHLDILLNESSPTTYASDPAVASELRSVTTHLVARRFRPVAIIGMVAALVLSAGAATASAADPGNSNADPVVVEITDDDCIITVHIGDQTQVVDVNDLPPFGGQLEVLDATVNEGDTITVTVVSGPDQESCIK
jgi:hypothetical protein